MKNKIVLITGATSGIGRACAHKFASMGADIILNGRKVELMEEIKNELVALGVDVLLLPFDVRDREAMRAAVDSLEGKWKNIDVLINNAGICSNKLLIDETYENILKVINTNLLGTINCCKQLCKHMMQRNFGKMINISSIWGICGSANESIYSASKGGVIAFSKAMAKELAYSNITVNCISPGVVETNMMNEYTNEEKIEIKNQIPLGRFASTNEIANLALFLACEQANYITGQVVTIDGGFTL